MGIKKTAARTKGTTRISWGDRSLMTKLWAADKNSRFEKRRVTRQMNKKYKEYFVQCPTYRGKKGCQSFLKEVKLPGKKFEVSADDPDVAGVTTQSRYQWHLLGKRHAQLLDEMIDWDGFVQQTIQAKNKPNMKFLNQLGGDCDEADDETNNEKDAITDMGGKDQMESADWSEQLPLLYAKKNMKLTNHHKRLAKRAEQVKETVTSSSSHGLSHHMFHSFLQNDSSKDVTSVITAKGVDPRLASGTLVNEPTKRYKFGSGGIMSTDGLWSLIDGNGAPTRLSLQSTRFDVSVHPLESVKSSLTLEEQNKLLQQEKRNNLVTIRHVHELERHPNVWTICQKCGAAVNTCLMVVKKSLGIQDLTCFHPECTTLDSSENFYKDQKNRAPIASTLFGKTLKWDSLQKTLNATMTKSIERRQQYRIGTIQSNDGSATCTRDQMLDFGL